MGIIEFYKSYADECGKWSARSLAVTYALIPIISICALVGIPKRPESLLNAENKEAQIYRAVRNGRYEQARDLISQLENIPESEISSDARIYKEKIERHGAITLGLLCTALTSSAISAATCLGRKNKR